MRGIFLKFIICLAYLSCLIIAFPVYADVETFQGQAAASIESVQGQAIDSVETLQGENIASGGATWYGCDAEPANVDSTTTVNFSYIFDEAYSGSAGSITKIEIYTVNNFSGLIVGVLTKSGSDFTDVQYTGSLSGSSGAALYTFNAPADFTAMPISSGQYLGFFSDIDLEKATTGGPGYWYLSSNTIGDDDADTMTLSGNTTHEIQIRVYVE